VHGDVLLPSRHRVLFGQGLGEEDVMVDKDAALEKLLEQEASPAMEKWIAASEEEVSNESVDIEGGTAQFAHALLESNEAMLPALRRAKIIIG